MNIQKQSNIRERIIDKSEPPTMKSFLRNKNWSAGSSDKRAFFHNEGEKFLVCRSRSKITTFFYVLNFEQCFKFLRQYCNNAARGTTFQWQNFRKKWTFWNSFDTMRKPRARLASSRQNPPPKRGRRKHERGIVASQREGVRLKGSHVLSL